MLRPLDIAAILLSAGITVLSAVYVYGGGGGERRVIIEGSGSSWVYPLDAEETVRVHGPLGDTVVQIHDGEARIVSSPCQNQVCVAAGEIHSHGQWVACLPNSVFLRIEGKGKKIELDASTW